MPVATFPIGPLDTNCHVLHNATDALIVDPGGDLNGGLQEVLDFIRGHDLTLRAVLLTHLHFDHIYGAATLTTGPHKVTAFAAAADFPLLSAFAASGEKWGLPPVNPFAPAAISEGACSFGSLRGEIRFTPGHTPGGLSFYVPDEKAVFAGDSLFYRSIGRTDLTGGHLETLKLSIQTKLFTLPDDTVVYPGHGPNTLIREEKAHNPYAA